jgi:hypothetical protein
METGRVFEPAVIGRMAAKASKWGGGTGVKDRMAILGTDDKAQYVAIKTIKAGSLKSLWYNLMPHWAPIQVAGCQGLTFIDVRSLAKRTKYSESELRALGDLTAFLQNYRADRAERARAAYAGRGVIEDVTIGGKLHRIVEDDGDAVIALKANGPRSLKVKPITLFCKTVESYTFDPYYRVWRSTPYREIEDTFPLPHAKDRLYAQDYVNGK